MTPNEEKYYLLDLLFESALWRVDPDDPLCAIELEIRDRIRRLTSSEEDTDAKPEPQAETEVLGPEDYRALEAARLNEYLERSKEKKRKQAVEAKSKWKAERVRCFENGRHVWHLKSQCRQVPRDNSHGGMPWMWKFVGENSATVDENSTTKVAQVEAMWAEHEKEEK